MAEFKVGDFVIWEWAGDVDRHTQIYELLNYDYKNNLFECKIIYSTFQSNYKDLRPLVFLESFLGCKKIKLDTQLERIIYDID